MNAAQEITQLTDEHRDGTIYADIEGDLWMPCLYGLGGWVVLRRLPFGISQEHILDAGVQYGPYRPVLGPPQAQR